MTTSANNSSFGPALFVGLCLFMLATGKPAPGPTNPALNMDMVAAAQASTVHNTADMRGLPILPGLQTVFRARILAGLPAETLADIRHDRRIAPPHTPTRVKAAMFLDAPVTTTDTPDTAPSGPAASLSYALRDQPLTPRLAPVADRQPPRPTRPIPPVSGSLSAWLSPPPGPEHTLRIPRHLTPVALPARTDMRPPAPPPLPITHPANTRLTVTGDFVHLRRAPNARAPIVGQFDSGMTGVLIETRGKWVRLHVPDHIPPISGWMFSRYLDTDP